METDNAVSEAGDAKRTAGIARIAVAPLIEDDAFVESQHEAASIEIPLEAITKEEADVLAATMNKKFSMRSLTGLSRDSGLGDKSKTNTTITSLINKGLLAQTESSSGQPRWYATTKGRQTLELAEASQPGR